MPELALLIPILAILGGIIHNVMKMRTRQIEIIAAQSGESSAQDAAKTERLEQRVAVLERILTDRSTQLGDEIERLRDRPVN